MAEIDLNQMAEFFVFFYETVPVILRNPFISLWLKVFEAIN